MRNWKSLLMGSTLAFAMSFGLVACPDEEEEAFCESTEDCADGLTCDEGCNVCITPCGEGNSCEEGLVCDTNAGEGCQPKCVSPDGAGGSGGAGTCTSDTQCDQVNCEICNAEGACESACGTNQTCEPGTADAPGTCVDPTSCSAEGCPCGVTGNSCNRCEAAPDADTNGAVIYDSAQNDLDAASANNCVKEPATCTNNGWVCSFRFSYKLAEGAALPGKLYQDGVKLVAANGSLGLTYNQPSSTGTSITFAGCFDEALTTVGGAVVLIDNKGEQSNALCFSGTTP